MKHVKLFEAWSDEIDQQEMGGVNPAQLVAVGDWSRILIDASRENIAKHATWIPASTYHITYQANPNPPAEFDERVPDMYEVMDVIFSGDQNGGHLAPKFYAPPYSSEDAQKGIIKVAVDGSLDPMEIKGMLEEIVAMGPESSGEGDTVMAMIGDGSLEEGIFTPEYIEYARKIAAGEPAIFPRDLVFEIE
jgi:hypothetical protein